MINSFILIFVFVLFVALAGLFAGAETGMYQLSRLRLRLGVEKKIFSYVLLSKALRDGQATLQSMLIGTNLTYYFGTSFLTYFFLNRLQNEQASELLVTLVATPIFFVFSELIPKNVFFYSADKLMPNVALVIFIFHKFFTWCGIVPVLKKLSHFVAQSIHSSVLQRPTVAAAQRRYIEAIIHDTKEEGFLSPTQTDIINRLVSIPNIRIRTVMTPVSRVQMVDINSDRQDLLKKLRKSVFARLPVYQARTTNIVGFINIYDCLHSEQNFTDLHQFVKPIKKLSAEVTVLDALNIMRTENQKIVLITRTSHLAMEKPLGIMTMKDLVEELLGELVEW